MFYLPVHVKVRLYLAERYARHGDIAQIQVYTAVVDERRYNEGALSEHHLVAEFDILSRNCFKHYGGALFTQGSLQRYLERHYKIAIERHIQAQPFRHIHAKAFKQRGYVVLTLRKGEIRAHLRLNVHTRAQYGVCDVFTCGDDSAGGNLAVYVFGNALAFKLLLRSPKDVVKREIPAQSQLGVAIIYTDRGELCPVEA